MKAFLITLFFPIFIFSQSLSVEINQLFDAKQYQKAETIALNFLKDNPDNIEAIELLGDTYGFQKKWDDAIDAYKKLVDAKPNIANYHYKYGGVLGMKALSVSKFKAAGLIGDLKNAFLKAAELDPNHIDTRWALVELYMQLPGIIGGSKKKALQFANELQNLSAVDGYLAKGYIYEYDEEYTLAEENYKKAVQVGGSLNSYQKLTNIYELSNQPVKAIENTELTLASYKDNALHYQIAKICAKNAIQLEKGLRHIDIFIANNSVNDAVPMEWAYYRKAQLLRLQNNTNEALKYIDKSLVIKPDFKEALKEKAKILD